MLWYELSRGLAYRRIQHPHMATYTWKLPIVLTVVMCIIYFLLPIKPVMLGKDGLMAGFLSILSTLPGFYFAGLAAVATFGGPYMDNLMPQPTPSVEVRDQGVPQLLELSRRQFLSYLFSYLVVISFFACMLILISNAVEPSLDLLRISLKSYQHGTSLWCALKGLSLAIFFGLISSIIVTTLHGLYFLTEKIHQT